MSTDSLDMIFLYLSKGFSWLKLKSFFDKWINNNRKVAIMGDTNWQYDNDETEMKKYLQNGLHFKQLVNELGEEINEEVQGMMLFEPNNQMSKFFKTTFVNPKRWGAMITERQIQDLLEQGLIGT